MKITQSNIWDNETKQYKICVNGTFKDMMVVGIFTFDTDCFYWHKLYVYKNGKRMYANYNENLSIENMILKNMFGSK